MVVRCVYKNPPLWITVWHHSATQLPNSDPRSDFFIHASHSWKSLIIFLSRLMSLNWFLITELFLTYQFIKDRVIPIFTEYRQNRPHITAQAFLLPTRDVWRHDAPNYRITSAVFYVYDVGLCNSDSKLQTSVDAVFVNKICCLCNSDSKFLTSVNAVFVNKNIKCGYCIFLVRTTGTFWHQNSLSLPILFCFAHLSLTLPCSNICRGVICKNIGLWYVRKKRSLMFSVDRKIPTPVGPPFQW